MSLHVYIQKKKYTVDIINRYTHIEIRFDCKEACLQIRAEPTLKVPPIKKNRTTPLSASDLVDIRDLLEKHGYSGVDYYDLGLRLGLLPRTLDVIENENKGNVRTGLRECLKAWLQQADNVKSKGVPTYDILIQALRDEKKNAVADGIKKELDD
uniref:Death domain-containing protein n=1 Tax=Amphimedon queenslandica TaxID=400682 RepID=A0A1X7T306_AMPQE